MTPLELATNDELVMELCRRFETIIFVGQKAVDSSENKLKKAMWRFNGDCIVAMGLCQSMIGMLMTEFENHEVQPLPPGSL